MINLEEGEYIVTKVRKHWWGILVWSTSLVVLGFLPLLFGILFFEVSLLSDPHMVNLFGLGYTVWVTILWVLFFVDWTDYYLDVWVVTNKRVVDIDHIGLFSRDVSTVRLDDIEDITTELHGVISTLLKFGTITLQTAGSRNEFYLRNAKNPEHAKTIIYGLISDVKDKSINND